MRRLVVLDLGLGPQRLHPRLDAVLALEVPHVLGQLAVEVVQRVVALGLAVVTWAAVRFGTGAASTATLALSLAAAASFGLASGALAPAGPDEGFSMLWGFIALVCIPVAALILHQDGRDLPAIKK